MVIFYEDQGNSRYGTAVVATTSGTSISYGTPIVFNSGTTTYINATYDPDTSQTVTVYKDETNSNYGTAIVGSVSGTSISFGSETVYASSNVYYNQVTYDTTNDKVIVAYMDYSASQYGYGAVGTVSGTSISFGTATVFESGSSNYISMCYDSSTDRSVIFYQDNDDSSKGKVVVGTTSGTSISFGSAVIFEATQVYETSSVFDSTANRAVVVFRTGGGDTQIVAGEVSGTSITVGTSVMVGSGANYYGKGIAFDSNAGKTVIPYENASGNAVYRLASVSGTTPSVDAEVTFNTPGGNLGGQLYAAYNSTDRVAVFTYAPSTDYLGYATVVRPVAFDETNLTAQAFVGVADSAISASAAGSIIVQGGTVTGMTLPANNEANALSTFESAGEAKSVVSIYNPDADRVVISYCDASNSNYLTLISGSVGSDGTITWGTNYVVTSNAYVNNYNGLCYDTANNKIVVVGAVQGVPYNVALYTVTQSGDTFSYVGGANISTGGAKAFPAFDPDTNQVLVVYRNGYGTASYYPSGVVVDCSPTTPTYGSEVVIESANSYPPLKTTYDTTANKFICCYTQAGGTQDAVYSVLEISGTSFTASTPTTFSSSGHQHGQV